MEKRGRGRPLGSKNKQASFKRTRAEIAAGLIIEEARRIRLGPEERKEEKRTNQARKKEANRRRRIIKYLESRILKREQAIAKLNQEIQQIKGIQVCEQDGNGFKTIVTGAIVMRDGRPCILTKNGNFMPSDPSIIILFEHKKKLEPDELTKLHQWLRVVLKSCVNLS